MIKRWLRDCYEIFIQKKLLLRFDTFTNLHLSQRAFAMCSICNDCGIIEEMSFILNKLYSYLAKREEYCEYVINKLVKG